MHLKNRWIGCLLTCCLMLALGSMARADAPIRINAGGSVSGSYAADNSFTGGTTFADATVTPNTTNLVNTIVAAPNAVYQTQRLTATAAGATITYTITALTVGNSYLVNLHYCELVYTTGSYDGGTTNRNTKETINGTVVNAAFRVPLKSVVLGHQYTATADSAGKITIVLTALDGDASFLSGIEILASTVAITYNASGPGGGMTGVASTNFTLSVTGTLTSNTIMTPSDGGAGGIFTPVSIPLAAGSSPSGTFTYTPASVGTKTISFTNNGTLTNPANLFYVASASLTTFAVTNANWYHSPGNWYSNGSGAMQSNNVKTSSTVAQSNAVGAYGRINFTGTQGILPVDESFLTNSITVMYVVDGGLPQVVGLTSSSTSINFTPTALTNGPHTVFYQLNSVAVYSNDRWSNTGGPGNILRVTGFQSDASSLSVVAIRPRTAWVFGDSITESQATAGGVLTNFGGSLLFQGGLTQSWWWILGDALNAEVGATGFSGQGWLTNNGNATGGVPTFNVSWNQYDGLGHGRNFTNRPDYAFINLGTNDALIAGGSITTTINTFLTGFRAQCPLTKIFLIIPFGQFRSAEIYATTRDNNMFILDNGTSGAIGLNNTGANALCADTFGVFVHPNIWGNQREAQLLMKQLPAYNTGTSLRPVKGGPVHK